MFISKAGLFTFLGFEAIFILLAIIAFEKGRDKLADLGAFLACATRTICYVANKIKLLIGLLAMALVGMSDKLTGIDATGFLTKVTGGDPDKVGTWITGLMITIALARFVLQSGMLASANRNGVDNPES